MTWTADITNDPDNDGDLCIELCENDEFRGRIEWQDGLLVLRLYSPDARVPAAWLGELLARAVEDLNVALLRNRAWEGASLLELVDLVHRMTRTPPYNRGIVLHWFSKAFQLHPLDFTGIIFAAKIFGDGASMDIDEANRLFRARLAELEEQAPRR